MMTRKKMKLENIVVKSFVMTLNHNKARTVNGGQMALPPGGTEDCEGTGATCDVTAVNCVSSPNACTDPFTCMGSDLTVCGC